MRPELQAFHIDVGITPVNPNKNITKAENEAHKVIKKFAFKYMLNISVQIWLHTSHSLTNFGTELQ
jgi:hypothetical protein